MSRLEWWVEVGGFAVLLLAVAFAAAAAAVQAGGIVAALWPVSP